MAESDEWPDLLSPQRLADASLLLPELAGLGGDRPSGASARRARRPGPAAGGRGRGDQRGHARGPNPGSCSSTTSTRRTRRPSTRSPISDAGCGAGRCCCVLAWRSERVPPGHRLRRLAVDLVARRARDDREPQAGSTRTRSQRLFRPRTRVRAAPDLEQRVYLESEGLPLFVAEYLAALTCGI